MCFRSSWRGVEAQLVSFSTLAPVGSISASACWKITGAGGKLARSVPWIVSSLSSHHLNLTTWDKENKRNKEAGEKKENKAEDNKEDAEIKTEEKEKHKHTIGASEKKDKNK